MEDIRDCVEYVKLLFRKEIFYQALRYDLSIEEIDYNIKMALSLLNEIDKLDDDTLIEVTYNPMGCYQYKIIGDDENE